MILYTLTISGTPYYLSLEGYNLANQYKPRIYRAGNITYKMAKPYGGFVKPGFGGIEIFPSFFVENSISPPPVSIDLLVEYTETTVAAATELFAGTLHLDAITRDAIKYRVLAPDYDDELSAPSYNVSVLSVFQTVAGNTPVPDLTVSHVYDRPSSPTMNYAVSSAIQWHEYLSRVAEFFTHYFYINGTTLYLGDMLINAGTITLDEFQVLEAPVYRQPMPYSIFTETRNDQKATGTYAYGDTYTVPNAATANNSIAVTALGNIQSIMDKIRVSMVKPLDTSDLLTIGQRVTYADNSLAEALTATFWVRNLTYNLADETVLVEGEGSLA